MPKDPGQKKPFVCINCAAVPDSLLESELFGHERGSFTGATATRDGKLRQANGGTLFLDEIGEMSLQGQAKILRAIETRLIQRVGGRTEISIDMRIIAATNRPLEELTESNLFRRDLFFRLNVFRLSLPPLRERSEDVPSLVEHFVRIFSRKFSRPIKGITKEAVQAMRNYLWPGNVRELRNVVEQLFVLYPKAFVGVSDLPEKLAAAAHVAELNRLKDRDVLMDALRVTGWNKSKVAERLKWSRMTVYRKMAQYGIPNVPRVPAAIQFEPNTPPDKELAARRA